jgi:hypothetical protein
MMEWRQGADCAPDLDYARTDANGQLRAVTGTRLTRGGGTTTFGAFFTLASFLTTAFAGTGRTRETFAGTAALATTGFAFAAGAATFTFLGCFFAAMMHSFFDQKPVAV